MGIGLLLFGVFLRLRRRRAVVLAAFLSASGFVLMLCHLAAFGLFALAVGACELACGIESARRSAMAAAKTLRDRIAATENYR